MVFEGKVVAITGAAGGIGRELCRGFGAEGAAIAALDRSPAVTAFAEELRNAGIKAEAAVADIGDANSVKEAFEHVQSVLGPVDCGLTAGNIVMARELTLEDL